MKKTEPAKGEQKRFAIATKKGYNLFDVSSAFQKSIRRCDVDAALYWAYELYQSNYEKYMWKRLLVMVTEEVGMADVETIRTVHLLYENYKILKELDSAERYRAAMGAVYLMAKAKKSGFFGWLGGNIADVHTTINRRIPPEALDQHTRRGKKMGKTLHDFFNEGSLLNNHHPFEDEEARKAFGYNHLLTQDDPKWKKCPRLPLDHPDRDPELPATDEDYATGEAPEQPKRRRQVGPAAAEKTEAASTTPTRRRTVTPATGQQDLGI